MRAFATSSEIFIISPDVWRDRSGGLAARAESRTWFSLEPRAFTCLRVCARAYEKLARFLALRTRRPPSISAAPTESPFSHLERGRWRQVARTYWLSPSACHAICEQLERLVGRRLCPQRRSGASARQRPIGQRPECGQMRQQAAGGEDDEHSETFAVSKSMSHGSLGSPGVCARDKRQPRRLGPRCGLAPGGTHVSLLLPVTQSAYERCVAWLCFLFVVMFVAALN